VFARFVLLANGSTWRILMGIRRNGCYSWRVYVAQVSAKAALVGSAAAIDRPRLAAVV
jgi:hypothetical protein